MIECFPLRTGRLICKAYRVDVSSLVLDCMQHVLST